MSIAAIKEISRALWIWPFLALIFAGLVYFGSAHGPWNYYWFFAMGCWFVLDAYWVAGARTTKPVVPPKQYRLMVWTSVAIHVLYCLPLGSVPLLGQQILPCLNLFEPLGALMCLVGVGFAIWARHTLAGNWNAAASLQQRHALVQIGPYAIIRHPIYLGFFLLAAGMFLALGEVRGLVCLCHASNFLKKLQIEEKILLTTYPKEYPEYARKVKRLLPYIW